jgi:hypothetical protein
MLSQRTFQNRRDVLILTKPQRADLQRRSDVNKSLRERVDEVTDIERECGYSKLKEMLCKVAGIALILIEREEVLASARSAVWDRTQSTYIGSCVED